MHQIFLFNKQKGSFIVTEESSVPRFDIVLLLFTNLAKQVIY